MNPVSIAKKLLAELGITELPTPLEKIAEAKGLSILRDKTFEDSVSGIFVPQKMTIIVNPGHPEVRQRFTIAHEIGHFLLHFDKEHPEVIVDERFAFYRNKKTSDGLDEKEKEANRFAAELLMPEDILRKKVQTYGVDLFDDFAISSLASTFNVSEQAMTLKLQSLDLGIQFI